MDCEDQPHYPIVQNLFELAEVRAEDVAFRTVVRQLTWRELLACATTLACELEGFAVRAGDVVGAVLECEIEFPVILLACQLLKVTFLPIDPATSSLELAELQRMFGFKVVIEAGMMPEFGVASGGVAILENGRWVSLGYRTPEQIGPAPEVLPRRSCSGFECIASVICMTSGSTSLRKGVMITQEGLEARLGRYEQTDPRLHAYYLDSDRIITQPPGRILSVIATLLCVRYGRTGHLFPGGKVTSVGDLIRSRPERAWGCDALLVDALLEEPSFKGQRWEQIKAVTSLGRIPERVAEAVGRDCLFVRNFGAAEFGTIIFHVYSRTDEEFWASSRLLGRPVEPLEYKLVDPFTGQSSKSAGELYLPVTDLFSGYVGEGLDCPFTEDGWYPTGDLISVSKEGIWTFLGKKAFIDVDGPLTRSSLAFEALIDQVPEVSAVAVVQDGKKLNWCTFVEMDASLSSDTVIKTKILIEDISSTVREKFSFDRIRFVYMNSIPRINNTLKLDYRKLVDCAKFGDANERY